MREAAHGFCSSGGNGAECLVLYPALRSSYALYPAGETMLRIIGPASRACDGVNRRDLMRIGALSLFPGVTWPRLLQAASSSQSSRPGSAKSVVLLNLFGGPSHLDMFDMKPAAPDDIRGEFKPISTSLPGLQICEHLPKLASWMHRATLIRTVTHNYNSHHPYVVLSGDGEATNDKPARPLPTNHPSMGSVCHYLLDVPGDVPPYVFLPDVPGYTQTPRPGGYAGYLGKRFDPLFTTCDPSFERAGGFYDPVLPMGVPTSPTLQLPRDLTIAGIEQRRTLLEQLNEHLLPLSSSPMVDAMDGFQQQAFSLLTSGKTRTAFDLSEEPGEVHERYGRNLYGQCMLMARRLVEAGTTFVTVNWEVAVEKLGGHWDMHQNNFGMLKFNLPLLDQICTALIEDLAERDLLESTMVIVTGEMGRSPRVNREAGRDHWPQCGFCLLIGAGISQGMVYGTSDKQGGYPIDRPVSPGDLVATIYQLLGIDPETTVPDLQGRPIHISHGGKPITEVIV